MQQNFAFGKIKWIKRIAGEFNRGITKEEWLETDTEMTPGEIELKSFEVNLKYLEGRRRATSNTISKKIFLPKVIRLAFSFEC